MPQKENTGKSTNSFIIPKDKNEMKNTIKKLMKEIETEKKKKMELENQYSKVCQEYDNSVGAEKTLKYIVNKIKENSNSIFNIIKYRKKLKNEMELYGFKVVKK